MKHLKNLRSGQYLCRVKNPKITDNVTDTGSFLSSPEETCPTCATFFTEYRQMKRNQLLKQDTPLTRVLVKAFN